MVADYCYRFQGYDNTFSLIEAQENSPEPFSLPAVSQWGLCQFSIKGLKTRERDWAKKQDYLYFKHYK